MYEYMEMLMLLAMVQLLLLDSGRSGLRPVLSLETH